MHDDNLMVNRYSNKHYLKMFCSHAMASFFFGEYTLYLAIYKMKSLESEDNTVYNLVWSHWSSSVSSPIL